jgi:hypothetical protein
MAGTYTAGWDLRFNKALTYGDYITLCERLAKALNTLHGITDEADLIRVEPEPITEGGWRILGGPGGVYNLPHFKTMRHMLGSQLGVGDIMWPTVPPDAMTVWASSKAPIIPASCWSCTYLKAFYGAPPWTQDELRAFQSVFQEFEITTIGQIPENADLANYHA